MRIAVLALQGAFAEHREILQRLGAEVIEIRQLSDWEQPKDGVILPGGEGTAQTLLLKDLGLLEPVRREIAGGLPAFGTCAGLILLAKQENCNPRKGIATMDIDVCRNAYGRQLGSFDAIGSVKGIGDDIPMTFIRAPYIQSVLSQDVTVLAETGGHIVSARQGNMLATAFHPELTADTRLHQYFLKMCSERT